MSCSLGVRNIRNTYGGENVSNYVTAANANEADAWKAFDGKEDTSWTASCDNTTTLSFNFDIPTEVGGVRIIPATSDPDSFPATIQLLVSDPGESTLFQTLTMETPEVGVAQEFVFDEPVTKRTFSFQPLNASGSASETYNVSIADVEFLVSRDIVAVTTPAEPVLQEKTVTPSTTVQNVTPDEGFDGLGEVTVEGAVLQEKTVTPTASSQIIVPDSGVYGLNKVTVGGIPSTHVNTTDATATASDILSGKTAYVNGTKVTGTVPSVTVATPSITVSSSGLITASTNQSGGIVTAGTQSATKQLTTKSAATITPGTSSKTIASETYLTGTQTISGDSNLIASNIKSGVSIFGVSGTYTGSSSGSAGSFGTIPVVFECSNNSSYNQSANFHMFVIKDGQPTMEYVSGVGVGKTMKGPSTGSYSIGNVFAIKAYLNTADPIIPDASTPSPRMTFSVTSGNASISVYNIGSSNSVAQYSPTLCYIPMSSVTNSNPITVTISAIVGY